MIFCIFSHARAHNTNLQHVRADDVTQGIRLAEETNICEVSTSNLARAKEQLTIGEPPGGAVDSVIEETSPRAVGHNIYILAHQLARHNDQLAKSLKPDNSLSGSEALQYYMKHTAQIEVREMCIL